MLSKKEQHTLRSKLFRHLDGIVTAPTAYVLHKHRVIQYIIDKKTVTLDEVADKFKANDGYLNVALRALCSQGWLEQQIDNESNVITFSVNDCSEKAFKLFSLYEGAYKLLRMSENYHSRLFEMEPFIKLEQLFKEHKNSYNLGQPQSEQEKELHEQVLSHIEGVIIGPSLVHLGMSGMFHKYFMQTRFKAEEFHKDPEYFERLLDILTHYGFFNKKNGSFEFTDTGLFFARRASAYGVTVSYIPTLRKLDDLLFGNPKILESSGADEIHVDREMNVWGSGGAHTAYFKVVDQIIIDIFNKPIEEQPKGVLDMGCGNGAFLQHIFSVIESQTKRGNMLDEHPLMLIGVDYNEAALKVSRRNVIQAEIWAKIIWGDIGNPDQLAGDLKDRYNIDLKELLNVRTFLDHNRIWQEPKNQENLKVSKSTGAYAYKGQRIENNLVIRSLEEHFNKWAPYVKKHGLLLIELHTIAPELTAQNIGRTPATAYDVTHGYSDQYIIEIDEFMKTMESIGLHSQPESFRKFPDSELATVSINLFKSNN